MDEAMFFMRRHVGMQFPATDDFNKAKQVLGKLALRKC